MKMMTMTMKKTRVRMNRLETAMNNEAGRVCFVRHVKTVNNTRRVIRRLCRVIFRVYVEKYVGNQNTFLFSLVYEGPRVKPTGHTTGDQFSSKVVWLRFIE